MIFIARNHKYGRQTYEEGDDDDDSYAYGGYGASSSGASYGYTYDEGISLLIFSTISNIK